MFFLISGADPCQFECPDQAGWIIFLFKGTSCLDLDRMHSRIRVLTVLKYGTQSLVPQSAETLTPLHRCCSKS
jgi:hypothetical protein